MQLSIEEMEVVFNGILAIACILMLIFISSIIWANAVYIIKELYFNKKQEKSEYEKGYADGYEDGLKQGLSIANEITEERNSI